MSFNPKICLVSHEGTFSIALSDDTFNAKAISSLHCRYFWNFKVKQNNQCCPHCLRNRNMILLVILSLATMFLASQSQPVSHDRILNRMSLMEPLCDVHTSYIFPKFEKNIYGLKRKILNGVIRQRVKIIQCLELNASWAIRSTVIAKCQQNFAEVKLFSIGKWNLRYY